MTRYQLHVDLVDGGNSGDRKDRGATFEESDLGRAIIRAGELLSASGNGRTIQAIYLTDLDTGREVASRLEDGPWQQL